MQSTTDISPKTANILWTTRGWLCVTLWPHWRELTLLKSLLPLLMDLSKISPRLSMRKFKISSRKTRTIRGYLLNHMSDPLLDLLITFKSAKIIWEKLETSMELLTLKRRNMWPMNACIFRLLMTSQSLNRFMSMRTCVLKFWIITWKCARYCG